MLQSGWVCILKLLRWECVVSIQCRLIQTLSLSLHLHDHHLLLLLQNLGLHLRSIRWSLNLDMRLLQVHLVVLRSYATTVLQLCSLVNGSDLLANGRWHKLALLLLLLISNLLCDSRCLMMLGLNVELLLCWLESIRLLMVVVVDSSWSGLHKDLCRLHLWIW